jgi:HlyD family secretion protein
MSSRLISFKTFFLLILAVAVAWLILNGWRGPKVETFTVERTPLIQTVVASGKVMTPRRVEVGTQITGRVARIPVEEGQTVKADQVLIELETAETGAVLNQAIGAVRQAEARLKQLQSLGLPTAEQSVVQAQANLDHARRNYNRTRQLREKGFIGEAQLDDAKKDLDVAESQLHTAQLQVDTNLPRGSDVQLAEAALVQARANLAAAQAKEGYTTVRAPVDGVLISRDVERGNVVQPGKALMQLAPAGQTQLVVQIDEKNLSLLGIGQKALGSADAYPDRNFNAVLSYINPGIDAQRGSVEVKLDVVNPPEYLRQDMTISADIEVARRASALVLPSETIHDIGKAEPWVFKVENDRLKRVPVKLGIRGEGKVEILQGLQAGDRAISAALAIYKDGQRIRPVPASGKP